MKEDLLTSRDWPNLDQGSPADFRHSVAGWELQRPTGSLAAARDYLCLLPTDVETGRGREQPAGQKVQRQAAMSSADDVRAVKTPRSECVSAVDDKRTRSEDQLVGERRVLGEKHDRVVPAQGFFREHDGVQAQLVTPPLRQSQEVGIAVVGSGALFEQELENLETGRLAGIVGVLLVRDAER